MTWDWRVDADLGGSIGTINLAPWMREWVLAAGKNTGLSFGAYGIPAVLEIQLDNTDGRFSPTNPGSPLAMHLNGGGLVDMHIPGVGRLIRARLAPFTTESGQNRASAKLTAYGALRELQTSEGIVPPLRSERTDLIVQRIARNAGIANRHIFLNQGTRTMPYFWAERSRNFDIVFGPVMYEGGALLDHRDYGVVFEPRDWRSTAPNDQIRANLGGANGYRVAEFDNGDEFDVIINAATIPYHSYTPGSVGTLYDWAGGLVVPGYGFLLQENGDYLLQENGDKLIAQEPIEQEFRVEISSDTPSAVDWSACVLTVTASVGDISSDCRLVGRSPTEAVVSIPRRLADYNVTAIRVTGPILARNVSGQESFRDPISIADLGVEYAPEVVPSWHSNRLEARQLAVDMVLAFNSQALVAKAGFWMRGHAADAWRRWVSDAVALDLITQTGVPIRTNGVIEQLLLTQKIGFDPYCEWTLSGLYRSLPNSAVLVMAPIGNVSLQAGTQFALELPEATGGDGVITYSLYGAPAWMDVAGRQVTGIAPSTLGVTTLTWVARDATSGSTIARSFIVTVTGIALRPPAVTVTGPADDRVRASWVAVANANAYEYRYVSGAGPPSGAWRRLGNVTSVEITGLLASRQYTVEVRALGADPYLVSPARSGSGSTATSITLPAVADITLLAGTDLNATLPQASGGSGEFDYQLDSDADWVELMDRAISGTAEYDPEPFELTWTAVDTLTQRQTSQPFQVTVTGINLATPIRVGLTAPSAGALNLGWSRIMNANAYEYRYRKSNTPAFGGWVRLGDVRRVLIENLAANTEYVAQLRAVGPPPYLPSGTAEVKGTTIEQAPASVLQPPGAPTGLALTPTPTTIFASWSPPTGGGAVSSYTLRYRAGSSGAWQTVNTGINRRWTIRGLQSSTSHQFEVNAVNAAGSSTWVRQTTSTTAPALQIPGPPSDLALTQAATSITASWSAPATGGAVASYSVRYRRTASSVWTTVNDIAGRKYTITGLISSTSYQVESRSVNAAGVSLWVRGSATTTAPALTAPGAPTNLALTPAATSMAASWSAPATGGAVASYDIRYRAAEATDWITYATGFTDTGYSIGGLVFSTSYQVEVRSVNTAGNSSWARATASTTAVADNSETLAAPVVTVSAILSDRFTASWGAISNASGYEYRFKTSAAQNFGNWITTGTGRTVIVTGLTNDTAYLFEVRAVGSGRFITSSAGSTSLTTADVAQNTLATPSIYFGTITTTTIPIRWHHVPNRTSYEYRYAAGTDAPTGAWTNVRTLLGTSLDGLDLGTTYTIQVRAVGSGRFATSEPGQVSAATDGIDPPTNLRELADSANSITVGWNEAAGVAGYEARWAAVGSALPAAWTDLGDVASRAITGLAASTSYQVEVRAYVGMDRSDAATGTFATAAAGTTTPGGGGGNKPRVPSFSVNAVPRWSYVSFDVETGIYKFRGWASVSVANPSPGVAYSGTGTRGLRTLSGTRQSQSATISGSVTGSRSGYRSRRVSWSVRVATF